jgi:hypothetical protein
MMRGYARYRSVVTSTGEILVRSIARSKKCRAALASRRGERKTSMTWPNWSMARKQIAPDPSDLDVGLIDVPAIPDDVLTGSGCLRELRREPLDPPVDAHGVDLDASFRQEFLDVPVGQAEPQVPADGQGDDLGWEPIASERGTRGWAGTRVSVRSHRASLSDRSLGDQCNSAGEQHGQARVHLYERRDKDWGSRRLSTNNNITATSGEGYSTPGGAERAAKRENPRLPVVKKQSKKRG